MQPILDLIAKRESIIEERIELEFLQKDPDRLKGRGATKQLMKEEKMTRRVTKELPKITSILEKTLRQWYVENRPKQSNTEDEERQDEAGAVSSSSSLDPDLGHFMYQGTPYLQTMQCQEEEWRSRKERDEQERQRKRQEERSAASSKSAAFGYSTYAKLPGKKSAWNPPPSNANNNTRPRSASTLRSARGSNDTTRSNPTRFGGRGPLGDVSSSKQNTSSRPPSRPRGGGARGGGSGKAAAGGGGGYRPASAPRMRL
jgi:protein regulator of cytokinesis 1